MSELEDGEVPNDEMEEVEGACAQIGAAEGLRSPEPRPQHRETSACGLLAPCTWRTQVQQAMPHRQAALPCCRRPRARAPASRRRAAFCASGRRALCTPCAGAGQLTARQNKRKLKKLKKKLLKREQAGGAQRAAGAHHQNQEQQQQEAFYNVYGTDVSAARRLRHPPTGGGAHTCLPAHDLGPVLGPAAPLPLPTATR